MSQQRCECLTTVSGVLAAVDQEACSILALMGRESSVLVFSGASMVDLDEGFPEIRAGMGASVAGASGCFSRASDSGAGAGEPAQGMHSVLVTRIECLSWTCCFPLSTTLRTWEAPADAHRAWQTQGVALKRPRLQSSNGFVASNERQCTKIHRS